MYEDITKFTITESFYFYFSSSRTFLNFKRNFKTLKV